MKKAGKILSLAACTLGLCLCLCLIAFANTVTVGVQATMPIASAVTVNLVEVNSQGTSDPSDDVWGSSSDVTAGATINFDTHTMTQTQDGVFLTGYYYVLDITPDGGGWSATAPINFTYTAGSPDLGGHAVATMVRAEYTGDTTPPDEIQINQVALGDLVGNVPASSFNTGWLRVYIGLADGSESASLGVTPFTAGTPGGTYTGTVTISYTGS